MADKTTDGSTEKSTGTTKLTKPAKPSGSAPASTETTEESPRRRPSFGGGFDVSKARTVLARILWGVCALFALVLALAALLIALEANPDNDLVRWIIERASNVDLGFFDLTNPIKDFDEAQTDPAKDVKTALFNYGIAAIIWLIIGRILDRIARP